jgi:hypothetical protein
LELLIPERCNYTTTNYSQRNNKIGPRSGLQRKVQHFSSANLELRVILSPSYNASLLPRLYLVGFLFAPEGVSMQIRKLRATVLASALTIFLSTSYALSQDGAKQDMKAAGTDTKNAAKDTGHAVSTGTKKNYNKTATGTKTVYHKTATGTKVAADKTADGTKTVGKDVGHGTKVAAKDTAHGTEKVGDKIAGKPTPQ